MNREDIVRMTASIEKTSIAQTEKIVATFLECVVIALAAGDDVRLKKFGSFEQRSRKPRTAVNPKTGKPMEIDARRTITFLPGDMLKGRLNP